MRKRNTTATPTKSDNSPKTEVPQAIRQNAGKGATQANESYEKASTATAEATAARNTLDCNAKVIEFACVNGNAAFDYGCKLLGVRSASEFLYVSTKHTRKQFEVLTEQAKELTALTQQVMFATTEPLQAGAVKTFRGPLF